MFNFYAWIQINIEMRNSVILLVIILTFIPEVTYSQEDVTHPYWAPKTWQLRADDITTIMGFRAKLVGNLNHLDRPTPTVINNSFVVFSQKRM